MYPAGIRSMFQSQASLMDYLTAKEARTELDQVNAHFAVAEVLICAFEQVGLPRISLTSAAIASSKTT